MATASRRSRPGTSSSATVVALGEGAGERYGLAVGDRAISEQIVPCWNAAIAGAASTGCARSTTSTASASARFGAMAEYMLFPAGALNYKVPTSIPPAARGAYRAAGLLDPRRCSAANRVPGHGRHRRLRAARPGNGRGGADEKPRLLIARRPEDDRLDRPSACGADLGLNPAKSRRCRRGAGLTEGYGCDVYIEATGHPAAVEQGLHMVRKLGTFVEFSVMREPVTVDWTIIGDTKELNVHGSHLGPYCYPVAIRMIERASCRWTRSSPTGCRLPTFKQASTWWYGQTSMKVTLEP